MPVRGVSSPAEGPATDQLISQRAVRDDPTDRCPADEIGGMPGHDRACVCGSRTL